MKDPAITLPDDVEALKAFALAMAEKAARAEAKATALETVAAAADARIARLMSILKSLQRARYGQRSEKLGKREDHPIFRRGERGHRVEALERL